MQNISVESDYSDSFNSHQSHPENQKRTNLLSQPDQESEFLTETNNMQNAGKRIGPKLAQNSNNLRTHLKDSPIYSTHDSGIAKSKSGRTEDINHINDLSVTDWNTESTPTERHTILNSKDQYKKPPQNSKFELKLNANDKNLRASASKKNSSRAKSGSKSSRNTSENDSKYTQEQENLLKVQNKTNSRGIKETDANQLQYPRNFLSTAADFKQPSNISNQNENRGNLIRSRGSFGNLHEKNRLLQTLPGDESDNKEQKDSQNKYVFNQAFPKTLHQKIEEQAQIVERVKLAGREHQKIALKTIKGSEKFKNKKQKESSRNSACDTQSIKLKNQQNEIPETYEFNVSYQNQNRKETEESSRRLETLKTIPSTPASRNGANQKKITNLITATAASSNAFPNSKQTESKKGVWLLSEEEKNLYGDRCPEEYQKIDLLGRGGFALVWLAKKISTGERVALKQILKKNAKDCMQKEIHFGQTLFEDDGIPRHEFQDYPGIKNIIRFIDYKHTKHDTWLVFELGGSTLSKMLFEIKGEFCKGERIYNVKHQELWKSFQENPKDLKAYIRQMAEVLNLLSDLSIVHCDIKPDNVLLTKTSDQLQIKVIDFGSAFSTYEAGSFGMATPEYMPPEVLGYLCCSPGNRGSLEEMLHEGKSWSIDVWSLGAILLEIITGVPLWLSLKCKIETKGKKGLQIGLFAVKGRDYEKIKLRQKAVLDNLESTIGEYLYDWEDASEFFNLLQGMLRWDPKLRISPSDILKHRYLRI